MNSCQRLRDWISLYGRSALEPRRRRRRNYAYSQIMQPVSKRWLNSLWQGRCGSGRTAGRVGADRDSSTNSVSPVSSLPLAVKPKYSLAWNSWCSSSIPITHSRRTSSGVTGHPAVRRPLWSPCFPAVDRVRDLLDTPQCHRWPERRIWLSMPQVPWRRL